MKICFKRFQISSEVYIIEIVTTMTCNPHLFYKTDIASPNMKNKLVKKWMNNGGDTILTRVIRKLNIYGRKQNVNWFISILRKRTL